MAAPQLKVLPSAPEELRTRPQWVVWRYEERDAKPTKVPYNPSNGKPAKSNTPSTWGTYQQVTARFQREAWDGVGYVFSADDPFCGIDLDGCIDPDTGTVAPAALQIVDALESYTEISPSGLGLHIIVEGTLPPGRRVAHELGIEMYAQGRFFTVTGKRLAGMAHPVAKRQEQLTALHAAYFGETPPDTSNITMVAPTTLDDRALIDIAARAVNGPRFDALWHGDHGAYPSKSESDLALCNYLAFYSGDPMRADGLFRQSGLFSEKWDEPHFADGRTYGQATIDLAFAGRTEFYTPRPQDPNDRNYHRNYQQANETHSQHHSHEVPAGESDAQTPPRYRFLSDEESDALPPISWLVDGVIPERAVGAVYGESQSGKTFMLLDLALSVAIGRPWKGHQLAQAHVAYIAGEDPYGVAERKRAWKAYYGISSVPRFHLLTENVPLMRNDDVHHLYLALDTIPSPLGLIIIDTLSCAMVGGDGNSTKDVVMFMEVVKALRAHYGCTVLLAHHKNKSGGELGNVTLRNSCDVMVEMVKDGPMVVAKAEKSKNAKPFEPIYMTMREHAPSAVLVLRSGEMEGGQMPETYMTALRTLAESFSSGANATTWAKATAMPEPTFYRALGALKRYGYINNTQGQRGERYVITTEGRSLLHNAYGHHGGVA